VTENAPRSPPKLELPRLFSWALAGASVALIGAGFLWKGVDFAAGVTLGCVVVGLNIAWTRRVISRALRGERSTVRVLISYMAKFGFTVLLLFLAILRFGIDPLAILVGVSALLVAVTVVAVARYAF
jgi:hypothetical protein